MNITIYIRRDVEEQFKDEQSKSRLINELLANHYAQFRGRPNPRKDGLPPISVLPAAKGTDIFVPRPPDPETGYPCCLNKRPCKHWRYDGNTGVWENELTGKIKEVV